MLKRKIFISAVSFLLISFITLSGCKDGFFSTKNHDITKDFISGMNFELYFVEDGGYYTIVDVTEEGKQQESLYFPSIFRDFGGYGIKVTSLGFRHIYGGELGSDTISVDYCMDINDMQATKFYFSYTMDGVNDIHMAENNRKEAVSYFIPYKDYAGFYRHAAWADFENVHWYVNAECYDAIMENGMYQNLTIHKANVVYDFNYLGAPNDRVLSIDNGVYGENIQKYPFVISREGYNFDGWYKEPECVNAWNFVVDKLPEAQYDGENNLIFQETRLYAKWL